MLGSPPWHHSLHMVGDQVKHESEAFKTVVSTLWMMTSSREHMDIEGSSEGRSRWSEGKLAFHVAVTTLEY